MDYFSVIILVIVTFVFISDRNVKSLDNIEREINGIDVYNEVARIKQTMEIIKINTEELNFANIVSFAQNSNKKYILIQNSQLHLNSSDIDTLIANYIFNNKSPCGFNLLYIHLESKWNIKRLYVDIVNYLNIFNKKELSTYGVILCAKQDILKGGKEFNNKLVSYTPSECTYINLTKEKINSINFKKTCINKIKKSKIDIIIKIILLIVSSSFITSNLIYSILNINNNFANVITSGVIYYCYSYIIKHIYKPLGKQRVFASYIFPLYLILYVIVGTYTICNKVIKRVQAS